MREVLDNRPQLFAHLILPVQVFDRLASVRSRTFAPTGHEIPIGIPLSEIRGEADELGLEGETRTHFIHRVRLCDAIALGMKYDAINDSLDKEKAKRHGGDKNH